MTAQFLYQTLSWHLYLPIPDVLMATSTSPVLRPNSYFYGFLLFLGYLFGSVPVGYLVVKLHGQGDVREVGSGGTGATNVTRRAGKWAGILTLILDALKGGVAVLFVRFLLLRDGWVLEATWVIHIAGFAAVIGHCFPVWLGFRGGKGVATALGVFLVLSPLAVLCAACVFVPVVWLTRYVSLASILAAITISLAIWLFPERMTKIINFEPLLVSSILISALVIFMHRANIARLVRGTENKLK